MDPTSLSTTSSATPDFLQSLGDIATGYLATRANQLLQNEAGGSTQPYYSSGTTTTPTSTSGLLASPILWIGAGAVLFVLVLLITKKRK